MVREIVFDGRKLNQYQRGRISGMVYVLAGMPDNGYGWCTNDDGSVVIKLVKCTDEQYETIIKTIDKVYPEALVKESES